MEQIYAHENCGLDQYSALKGRATQLGDYDRIAEAFLKKRSDEQRVNGSVAGFSRSSSVPCIPPIRSVATIFDLWAHRWKERYAQGGMIVLRYCDDFIVGFEHWLTPSGFRQSLASDWRKFGLDLHAGKTV